MLYGDLMEEGSRARQSGTIGGGQHHGVENGLDNLRQQAINEAPDTPVPHIGCGLHFFPPRYGSLQTSYTPPSRKSVSGGPAPMHSTALGRAPVS